ncbi:uncharacterized protein AB675_11370 [Cyphellophora attinorum]|uniref:F-box domain-containing protein n=1 Tax=Cyphellophora attinorum TaxID=1664694 RepID=A0A0N1H8Z5_9EURO|nr:uncharacterized protein AB675_11370 [Phialophora attinorum]KPI39937.1 hypothetical protein AB675_11370 [Phialophora attinorum]
MASSPDDATTVEVTVEMVALDLSRNDDVHLAGAESGRPLETTSDSPPLAHDQSNNLRQLSDDQTSSIRSPADDQTNSPPPTSRPLPNLPSMPPEILQQILESVIPIEPAKIPRYPPYDAPRSRGLRKRIWAGWSDPQIHDLLLVSKAFHGMTLDIVRTRQVEEDWAGKFWLWVS